MAGTVRADTLEDGCLLALEHAAHLVEDAALMHAGGRYSTAYTLAVMAREELGRHFLLWRLAEQAARGTIVHAKEARFLRHIVKLEAGISTFYVQLSVAEVDEMTTAIDSDDKAALARLRAGRRARLDAIKKGAPDELHRRRLAAQYVDLAPDNTSWSLPSATTREASEELVITLQAEVGNALANAYPAPAHSRVSVPDSDAFHQRVSSTLFSRVEVIAP